MQAAQRFGIPCQVAHRIVGVGSNSVAGEGERERRSRAGFVVSGQRRDVAVAVVGEVPLGPGVCGRVRRSRIVLRISQAGQSSAEQDENRITKGDKKAPRQFAWEKKGILISY